MHLSKVSKMIKAKTNGGRGRGNKLGRQNITVIILLGEITKIVYLRNERRLLLKSGGGIKRIKRALAWGGGGGRVSCDKVREWHGHIYTTKFKIDSQWEAATQQKEISSVLCDHLEGWDKESRRKTQEGGDMGIYVYIQLIHFVIKQKLTHHCKAIIL